LLPADLPMAFSRPDKSKRPDKSHGRDRPDGQNRLDKPEKLDSLDRPLPRNLVYLNRHMKMNHCLNVDVLPYAVSDCELTAEFKFSKNPSMGHLSTKGDITVQTVLIDRLIESRKVLPPDVMKIDVEGAELSVLRGSHQVIKGKRPIIFVATHGTSTYRDCMEFLHSLDYHLTPIGKSSITNCDEVVAEPY